MLTMYADCARHTVLSVGLVLQCALPARDSCDLREAVH